MNADSAFPNAFTAHVYSGPQLAAAAPAVARTNIVFVADNLTDWKTLARGVPEGTQVVVLDSRGNGLQQMADWLATQPEGSVDAVHLLSHGAAGQVQLGSLVLTADNLHTQANALAQIQRSLTEDGDWLLYGCDVAAGAQGVALVQGLALFSRADIAASIDRTGSAALGGNWTLEATRGSVDALSVQLRDSLTHYQNSLSTQVAFTGDTGNTNSPVATFASGTPQSSIAITATGDVLNVAMSGTNMFHDTVANFAALGMTLPTGSSGMVFVSQNDNFVNSITLSVQGGKVFDFVSMLLMEANDEADTFTFTPNGNAAKKVTLSFAANETKSVDLSANTDFDNLSTLTISTADGNFQARFDNIVLENIRAPNAAPTLGGITAATSINDTATATPFSTVTITDTDNVTVSVTLDASAKGVFTPTSLTDSGFTSAGGGVYNLASTTAALAQAAIRQLVFNPTDNRVAAASTEATTFTISVNDGVNTAVTNSTTTVTATSVNDAPTNVALSASTVAENTSTASALTVGALSSTDPDTGSTFTYSIVGGTDQASFQVNGANLQLKAGSTLDYEAQGSYAVTVRSTDQGGLTYDKALTINLMDVNEAPTVANAIGNRSANATQAFNYQFANNTFADVDAGQTLTYTATKGDGSALPGWLSFDGNSRTFSGTPNSGDAGTFTVKVTATDNGAGSLNTNTTFDISVAAVPTVSLSVSMSTVAEAAGSSTVTATLSATTSSDTTVTVGRKGSSTATLTDDFTLSPTTITILAGQITGTATLTAVQDTLDEADETVIIEITGVAGGDNATENGTQEATVTITDDDPLPSLSIANANLTEGNSGSSNMTFTVTLGAASGKAVTVDYATSDNASASAGADYTAASGTLTFNPGDISKTFTVPVLGDVVQESSETFTVTLSNASNATLSTSTASGTINDDENLSPTLSSPTAISLTDTAIADAFIHQTGTLIAADSDGTIVSYGITGGTTGGSDNIGGLVYDVSKAGIYGTLYVVSTGTDKGKYVYVPESTVINARSADDNEAFTVTATDNDAATADATLTVNITGANDTPAAVNLSSASVNQSSGANAMVGTFSTTDAEASQTHTYSLVAGNGSNDTGNASFTISGDTLRANDASALAAGTYNINVRSTDNGAGNLSYDKAFTVTVVDNVAPTVTSIVRQTPSTSPTNADSLTWRVTFNEPVTGIDIADFSVSGTTATVASVTQVGSTNAYDVVVSGGNLANLNATATLAFAGGQNITDAAATPSALAVTTPSGMNNNTFVVDNTAPALSTVTIASNNANTAQAKVGDTVTVSFTTDGTQSGSPTATILGHAATVTNTGGNNYTATYTLVNGDTDGAVSFSITASDAAGNTMTAVTAVTDTSAVNFNKTAPTLAISTVATDDKINDAEDESSVTIRGTCSGADGQTVSISVAGVATKTATVAAGGAWSVSLSSAEVKALSEGYVSITADVSDAAGNAATQTVKTVIYDKTAPTTAFSGVTFSTDTGASNTDLVTNEAHQTITATLGNPPVGTDKVWGSLDNGVTWVDITAMVTGTTLSWTPVTLSGSNTLKLRASDAAGNDGTVSSQVYVLDTRAPVFLPTITTPADNATTFGIGNHIVVKFDEHIDAGSDFTKVYLKDVTTDTLVSATFTLNADGHIVINPAGNLDYSKAYYVTWEANALKDVAGNTVTAVSDKATFNFTTEAYNEPPIDPPPPIGGGDGDGVSDAVEIAVPTMPGSNTVGDGNGDGIPDASQAAVSSAQFRLTKTISTDQAAPPTYITLVAGSTGGKANASLATISEIRQLDAPANMPDGMTSPLGLISFKTSIGAIGSNESFSLYVDPKLGVNGYWKQDASGTWTNLASEAYGGKMVEEGGKLRLDFQIVDGGQFDSDGVANGSISDPGIVGAMTASITEHHPKLPVLDHFWF